MAGVGAAACLVLLASSASAQAWIGTMVGQMAAEQEEARCQADRQPAPQRRDIIINKINGLMLKLQAPQTNSRDLAKLFSTADGAKIANVTELITPEAFRERLGPAEAKGEWKQLVVGADHAGARGVWRVVIPGVDGGPETVREFGFDFVGAFGTWKVLHAQEYPGPLFAPDADIFCHLREAASY